MAKTSRRAYDPIKDDVDDRKLTAALAKHRTLALMQPKLRDALPPGRLGELEYHESPYRAMEFLVADTKRRADLRAIVLDLVNRNLPILKEIHRPTVFKSADLPSVAVPEVFEGRDQLLADIVASIFLSRPADELSLDTASERGPIVLHGDGGIGKSTVAIETLRHPDVAQGYNERRYFVKCDEISTADELIGGMFLAFGLEKAEGRGQRDAIVAFLALNSAVVVLDNFEGLCFDGLPGPTRDLLSSLGAHTQLIITKRGVPNINVRGVQYFAIGPLDGESSCRAFKRHAGVVNQTVEDGPDLSTLLERLEGYPLAISLIARALEPGLGLGGLLRKYDAKRSALLHIEVDGEKPDRQTSLTISIQLSLESAPMRKTPEAKQLCLLLAMLPDGAHEELMESAIQAPKAPVITRLVAFLINILVRLLRRPVIGRLLEVLLNILRLSRALREIEPARPSWSTADIDARAAVQRAGLASYQPSSGLLRMVAPLREFFTTNRPVSLFTYDRLLHDMAIYFSKLAASAQNAHHMPTLAENLTVDHRVQSEIRNISRAILRGLKASDPAEASFTLKLAGLVLKFVGQKTAAEPPFVHAALQLIKTRCARQEEANFLLALGKFSTAQYNYDRAHFCLTSALDMYRAIGAGDPDAQIGEANALLALGELSFRKGDYNTAAGFGNDSFNASEGIGYSLGAANCLELLGGVAQSRGDFAAAEQYLELAIGVHRQLGHSHGELHGLLMLGNFANQRHDREAAQRHFDAARQLNEEQIGDLDGKAQTLWSLGTLAIQRGELVTAERLLNDATQIQRDLGRAEGSIFLQAFGELARARNEPEIARRYYEDAIDIARRKGMPLAEAQALLPLGDLALAHGDLESAEVYVSSALILNRDVGARAGEAACLQALSRIHMARRDFQTASDYLVSALDIHQAIGNGREEVDTLVEMGWAALGACQPDTAAGFFERGSGLATEIAYSDGNEGCRQGRMCVAAMKSGRLGEMPIDPAAKGHGSRVVCTREDPHECFVHQAQRTSLEEGGVTLEFRPAEAEDDPNGYVGRMEDGRWVDRQGNELPSHVQQFYEQARFNFLKGTRPVRPPQAS